MKTCIRAGFGFFLALACAASFAHAQQAAAPSCAPDGGLHYICDVAAPEDIVAVPGTRWLIASGMKRGAGLKLVDGRAKTARVQTATVSGSAGKGGLSPLCPGAPDAAALNTHGLSLQSAGAGAYTLYAVSHGAVETIQVYALDARGDTPMLTWKGCVPLPAGHVANAVTAFPDGTILATILTLPGTGAADFLSNRVTGIVMSWKPGEEAFRALPGTGLAGNNGIEAGRDGDTFYVSATGDRAIVAFSRRDPSHPLWRVTTPGFIPDNIHWSGELLIAAGMRDDEPSCGGRWRVVDGKVSVDCHRGFIAAVLDPAARTWRVLAQGAPVHGFNGTATATLAGDMLWLGSFTTDRLAYRTLP